MNQLSQYSTEVEKYIYHSFKDLRFEEERHLYSVVVNGRLIYLPSVSSKVESHANKFNPNKRIGSTTLLEASARKASRERGEIITADQLQLEWTRTNKEACDLGHRTHEFLENFTGIQVPCTPQERAGIKFIKSLAGKYRISFRELRAYSKEFLYAGTMDLPLEEVEGGYFDIDDYKTNGDLFKAHDYLKPPFQYMESSPYNKYQLQLSYYQIMLEEIGLLIRNRNLVHLRDDGEFVVYPLQDLTEPLKDYMKFNMKAA